MNSPIFLDVLHMRRPTLNYVSPAICDAVFSSTSFPILVLDPLPVKSAITGLRITFIGTNGDFLLNWDNYPGALCYSVYKLNDATDPFSDYVLIAECISDTEYDPNDWEIPFLRDEPGCYIVTAITREGETIASEPICTDGDGDGNPDVPPSSECISNTSPLAAGEVGTAYSVTLTPDGPAAGPQWTITGGALPTGLSLNLNTGEISGTPTVEGSYTFTVRLTKDGGGFCEEVFTIEIEAVITCAVKTGALAYSEPAFLPHLAISTDSEHRGFATGLNPFSLDSFVFIVDTENETFLSSTNIGADFLIYPVYAEVNTTFWAIEGTNGETVRKHDKDGAVLDVITVVPPGDRLASRIAYEPTTEKIYGYASHSGTDDRIYVIDPVTNAVTDTVIETNASTSFAGHVMAAPGFIYVQGVGPANNLEIIEGYSVPGFAHIGTLDLSTAFWGRAFAYAPNTGKVYFSSGANEIFEVNPATLAIDYTYTAPVDFFDTIESLAYDATQGRLIGITFNGIVLTIDPIERTFVCAEAGGFSVSQENMASDGSLSKFFIGQLLTSELEVWE